MCVYGYVTVLRSAQRIFDARSSVHRRNMERRKPTRCYTVFLLHL